jgi:hypothetical protein
MVKMRDILTKKEHQKIDDLLIELLGAHSKKEANLIKTEIDEIFVKAKERHLQSVKESK